MTRWLYKRVMVWALIGDGEGNYTPRRDVRGWHLDTGGGSFRWSGQPDLFLRNKLYAGGRSKTRLPSNRDRDWSQIERAEWLAWDDDGGHLDLAMEVVAKLGFEGWELAGIQLGSLSVEQWPISYYVFKKPAE